MEACGNCGRAIGNLETPFLFREKVVCQECHKRLTASEPVTAPLPPIDYNLVSCASCGKPIAAGATKCPSCGQARGFDIGRFLLLLVFVLFLLWVIGQAARPG